MAAPFNDCIGTDKLWWYCLPWNNLHLEHHIYHTQNTSVWYIIVCTWSLICSNKQMLLFIWVKKVICSFPSYIIKFITNANICIDRSRSDTHNNAFLYSAHIFSHFPLDASVHSNITICVIQNGNTKNIQNRTDT